jgi:hypothetical protein
MTLYQEIRAAGKSMHDKALDATQHLGYNAVSIAKRMTLPTSGRTLIFDGEADQNAFFDFWFHEYRINRKSLAESVDPVTAAGIGRGPIYPLLSETPGNGRGPGIPGCGLTRVISRTRCRNLGRSSCTGCGRGAPNRRRWGCDRRVRAGPGRCACRHRGGCTKEASTGLSATGRSM